MNVVGRFWPPPWRRRRPLWSSPGLFVAWGLANETFTPEDLAARAQAAGFAWVALEDSLANTFGQERFALAAACKANGLRFGIWQPPPLGSACMADFESLYIANVEGPRGHPPGFPARWRTNNPGVPAAVITNFGGLETPADCAPWIEAGFACIPEAYLPDNPNASPLAMVFEAKRRGWPTAYPALGVYRGFPLASYHRAGLDGWSVYLAEEMTPADWQAVS